MIARASSGSRSSINSVEPLMSANKAVTVLRSPSSVAEASGCSGVTRILGAGLGGAEGATAAAIAVPSGLPQSPQNFFSGGFSAPHCPHRFASGAPQSPQNRLLAGFSAPHFAQRIVGYLASSSSR